MNGFQFLKYPSRISRTKNWVSKNGIFAFGFLEKYVGDDVDGFAFGFLWTICASTVDLGSSGCKKMVDLGNCRLHTVLYGLYHPLDVNMILVLQGRAHSSSLMAPSSLNINFL
nr:G-type lectin S-receptor-like serine/threonine-protein kinase SD3-1 [Ipomoea batatas]